MFYFQAKVEQSVPFLLLSTFSSYYGAKPQTNRTGTPAIHESMSPARCPENTRPACTPGTNRTNPPLSYQVVEVPVQTWTPSPHT